MSWPINLRGKARRSAGPTTANMEFWFRKGIGITSAANAVSNWANQDSHGSARDIAQATGASQPTLQPGGSILMDGGNDFLKAVGFTLIQPETVYIRLKQTTWTLNEVIFSGDAVDSGLLLQAVATPGLGAYAGTALPGGSVALGSWGSVAVVFNGASSVIQVSGGSTVTGAAGAANMSGVCLGCNGGASGFANVEVAEFFGYSAAHDAATRAANLAYLDTI